MKLPELPKQNNKDESDFGIVFRKWWNTNRLDGNFELKDTRGKSSIPFKSFELEQETVANLSRSDKGILLRHTVGTPGTPDYSAHKNRPTWIVIKYPKVFHVISTETFILERDRSTRKSLTGARAKEISTISVKCG